MAERHPLESVLDEIREALRRGDALEVDGTVVYPALDEFERILSAYDRLLRRNDRRIIELHAALDVALDDRRAGQMPQAVLERLREVLGG
jgi:hypothetical protein